MKCKTLHKGKNMTAKRRIEITEERMMDGAEEYLKNDIVTIDKAKADQWIEYGWAKCAQTGEQGKRKPGARAVTPANVHQR